MLNEYGTCMFVNTAIHLFPVLYCKKQWIEIHQ